MSVFLTSFCGGIVGGALIAVYHISRYNRLVERHQLEMLRMVRCHDRIAQTLNERIALLEEERRARH